MRRVVALFLLAISAAIGQDSCFDNYIVGKPVNIRFNECDLPKSERKNIANHNLQHFFCAAGGRPYPLEVNEIKLGNTLFNTKNSVSLFFVGEPIQICMKGRFREDVSNLQNLVSSVHGDVQIIGNLLARQKAQQISLS